MIRGALVEQELFGRYDRVRTSYLGLQEELEAQKAALERTLLTLAMREDELAIWRRGEDKWRWEVEMRERMIDGLNTSNNKKSAEISRLKEDLGHFEHDLREGDGRIKFLEDEVELERRESTIAFERARLACQNAKSLYDQQKEEKTAHEELRQESNRAALEAKQQRESSLAEIQALQGRLAHLESKAHRFEIVEGYHNSTLGEVEMALACKAGYNYLEAQLPIELRNDLDRFHYPPRVANYLGALQEIEKQGGGFMLDGGSGNEDDGESAEEAGEGSAHDSWVSQPEEKGDEEVEAEAQSTPLPTFVAAPPSLTPIPSSSVDPPASLLSPTP